MCIRDRYWRSLIEVAALGTVSDMMPLTPENRALVAEGIQQMRVTARPGYIAVSYTHLPTAQGVLRTH